MEVATKITEKASKDFEKRLEAFNEEFERLQKKYQIKVGGVLRQSLNAIVAVAVAMDVKGKKEKKKPEPEGKKPPAIVTSE